MERFNTERIVAIVRLACTLAASMAAGFGYALDADALVCGALTACALATYVWSWWCNNNVTQAAQDAQRYLDEIKAQDKEEEA